MSNTNVLVVKDKVQRFAKQFFNHVQLDDDGNLSIPYESTNVHIEVFDLTDADPDVNAFRKDNDISVTAVQVWAMVLLDVKGSNDLYKWVAIEGQQFLQGSFKLVLRDDGLFNLVFSTTLAGDTLDAGELKGALAAIAISADNEDENLKKKFGGRTVEDARNQ